jgi:hypothetical protein
MHNFTAFDIDQSSAGDVHESQMKAAGGLLGVEQGFAAVAVAFGGADHVAERRVGNSPDPGKGVRDLFFLRGQLAVIVDVLVTAAAAPSVIAAKRAGPQ